MNHLAPYLPQYPLHSFPGLLGKLAHDLKTGGGVAAEIIGTVLIAIASLLTQGIAGVAWPNGLIMTIGANAVLGSSSGSGKSLIYEILMLPIEEYLAERNNANNGSKQFDFLIEDATREAIVQSLHEWPVAGLFTDEAGQLKRLLKDSATLVKLLAGATLRNARVSTGRVALADHCFCMLLMEQPDIFKETKAQLGVGKGGVGLINRFFVVLQNGFPPGGSPHHVGLSPEVESAYEKVVRELLGASIQNVEQKVGKRPTVRLCASASQYLVSLDREVRRKCAPGSPWFLISEYALRHVERLLRLAGVLHVFEDGAKGEISLDTLQRAEILGNWYIDSFYQAVYEPPKQTQVELDAAALEQAFFRYYQSTGISQVRQSELRAFAVNLGLTPTRFTRALAALGGQGKVCVFVQQNTPWVALIVFPSLPY